ncbi:MAG: hypothetical protein IPK97_00530 [Ahniella sp.]|nr:hypothetical protein [Ahniella sp.]
MKRHWILPFLFVATGSVQATQTEIRLDFPGSRTEACSVDGSPISSARLRVQIRPDSEGVYQQQFLGCHLGNWTTIAPPTPSELHHNAGEAGFDELIAQIPRGYLNQGPTVTIAVVSVDEQGRIIDEARPLGTHGLSLAGNPLSVPALGSSRSGVIVLFGVLGLFWLWRMRRHSGALLVSGIALMIGASPVTEADLRIAPAQLDFADAANDSVNQSAAYDLRAVSAILEDRMLKVRVSYSNLERALLADTDRMLFIGNSLTSTNSLPQMLSRIALQAGKTLEVKSIVMNGASLEEHWYHSATLREIEAGNYPVVSLQQGPSSLPESQDHLLSWSVRFNAPIRANGGRPLLFMVWPDWSRLGYLDDVRNSYETAATMTEGAFAPAGIAWQRAWADDPQLALYGPDGFHPSELGTYLAALTLFCTVYQQSPEGLPAQIPRANGASTALPEATARLLQRSAWTACQNPGFPGR